jgi:hypothetical protein
MDVLSLRGRLEYIKYCIGQAKYDVDRVVLERTFDIYAELFLQYGVDVLYKVPADMILLSQFEKNVFSQFAEDGITERIFETIGFTNKFYLDFGGTATNNNSEILHKNHGFTGVLWNCDDTECEYTKIHTERVDADNILELCKKYEVPVEFDFLSIDIDGNDWYVFRKICSVHKPRVVVIEYNSTFPPPEDKVVVYDPDSKWDVDTYQGASMQAMYNLARTLGYSLVAAESFGYNLFFVRGDIEHNFYGVNDVKFLYRTPKLGHRPCGEDGKHTEECLKTYRMDGIMPHKACPPEKVWVKSVDLLAQ